METKDFRDSSCRSISLALVIDHTERAGLAALTRGATNVTSERRRDPVTDPLLTPENSALVVIDYQPSQTQTITSIDRDLLVRNIVSVARLAKT
jgi:hypothetical protein